MGVCTNCATPVGQSLLYGGASTRLTVAAMISSPCFNPVVLAMAFVLFPLPLALARVVMPGLLIAMLPLLIPENRETPSTIDLPDLPRPVSMRLLAFISTYGRNLLRVTLLTLPWMLLAALLGAVIAELVPTYGTHLPVSALGVVAIALFGTFLPVPMAFDVALAFVLYRSGVPVPYVAALLCTLGPISVYSLTALSQQLGRAAGLRLAAATAALGCVAGWIFMLVPVR